MTRYLCGIDYQMFLQQQALQIRIPMKSFSILETLIYNPTLKSEKKKPIESDIQQAKIVAYVPSEAPIEQKCNTVGMAEGVYEFNRCLLTQQEKQKGRKQLVIFMDNCCLVEKQYEDNTWLFLKLAYDQHETNYTKYGEEEENSYIDNIITEEVALNILDHFYLSFLTFYGPISAFVFLKKQQQLQKILAEFLVRYDQNNRIQQSKRLDASSFLLSSVRAIPLDINSTLKFNYFKNVLESYDQNLSELIIFSHGLLAFTSLPKELTSFFQNYFFGVGEPFNFSTIIQNKKLQQVTQLNQVTETNKYGTFFNSLKFGLGNAETDMRISTAPSIIKKTSSSPQMMDQDLLGITDAQSLAFPIVYVKRNGEYNKYYMTYFMEKKMLFITFYRSLNSKQQIIFQNRFYFDNISKFSTKITDILTGITSQVDTFKFIYCNLNTFTGKISIQKWNVFVPEMRYIWNVLEKNKQSQVATTIQNHWIYGIHRLNRVLILMIPSEIPLHKLDDFAERMFKDYFFKAYM